jgi:hypothetical protein
MVGESKECGNVREVWGDEGCTRGFWSGCEPFARSSVLYSSSTDGWERAIIRARG